MRKKDNPTRSMESTLEWIAKSIDQGLLPAMVLSDAAIYELEMERLFARSWLYLGHESEVPKPGDYVARSMAADPVLLIRSNDGEIRVLLNACRHRGNIVCRAERGNTTSFQCSYHGWRYDNTGRLVTAPGMEAYGDKLDPAQWGLVRAAKVERYNGLIFATFNPEVPSLDEYLGGMKWYLDLVTKRSDAGLQAVGAPHRWIIPANWKLPADQFVGDTAHFPYAHISALGLGTWPMTDAPPWVANISLENGHGVWIRGVESGYSLMGQRGYSDSFVTSLKSNLLPAQVEALERTGSLGGNLLPNLAFMDLQFADEPGSPSVGYLSLRLWNPISVDQTEVWSWCMVERDTSPEFKDTAYKAYLRGFGPSGAFEQDDMIVWAGPTRTAKGPIGRTLLQNISMGMANTKLDQSFPGPGKVYVNKSRFLESNLRAFYRSWLENLVRGA